MRFLRVSGRRSLYDELSRCYSAESGFGVLKRAFLVVYNPGNLTI